MSPSGGVCCLNGNSLIQTCNRHRQRQMNCDPAGTMFLIDDQSEGTSLEAQQVLFARKC